MRFRATSILVFVFFVLSVAAMAGDGCCPGKCPSKPDAKKKCVSAICPVTKNNIPDVSKVTAKSVYKGKTYYFCCPDCKPKFDQNPENYIKKDAPAKPKK